LLILFYSTYNICKHLYQVLSYNYSDYYKTNNVQKTIVQIVSYLSCFLQLVHYITTLLQLRVSQKKKSWIEIIIRELNGVLSTELSFIYAKLLVHTIISLTYPKGYILFLSKVSTVFYYDMWLYDCD